MNSINIAGHLGADPEVRFTSNGKKVTTMIVACRTRKGQTDDTIWYRVTIWGEQYDKMIPHFKKGSAIIVSGELHKPELFTNREGKQQISSLEVTAHNIQFSPFGKPGGQSESSQQGQPQTAAAAAPSGHSFGAFNEAPKGNTIDDEVPF
jgi:single-strand DNA-binding protein